MKQGGWIGVDLDGTLAHYEEWRGISHIGEPIPLMAKRVRDWLGQGIEVRIFTARVSPQFTDHNEARAHIQHWTRQHFGTTLAVTSVKDFQMVELWDDRAVRVETNTGRRIPVSEGPENLYTIVEGLNRRIETLESSVSVDRQRVDRDIAEDERVERWHATYNAALFLCDAAWDEESIHEFCARRADRVHGPLTSPQATTADSQPAPDEGALVDSEHMPEYGPITVAECCQLRIAQVRYALETQRGSRRQELESGLAFLVRALEFAQTGHPLAGERYLAAERVLGSEES